MWYSTYMPSESTLAPVTLSDRTLAKTLLPFKVVAGNEPVPTIHTLARVLLNTRRTRVRILQSIAWLTEHEGLSPETASKHGAYTSRIQLTRQYDMKNGETVIEPGCPDIRPLDKPLTTTAVLPEHRCTPEDLAALYDELVSDYHDAAALGEHLDGMMRRELPGIATAQRWKCITTGAGMAANWVMESIPERIDMIDVVTF